MTQHLDWTYAFTHRLQGTSCASSPYAAQANACAKRLAAEVSTLPFLSQSFLPSLEKNLPAIATTARTRKHMLVLGIGGSALGARALQKAFFPAQDRPGHTGPWLWIADNIDADTLTAWMRDLPPADTSVVVISKSGGTIETMAQYFLIKEWLKKSLGTSWANNVIIITDEKNGPLRAEATAQGITSLPVPDHLGGRYSILSAVGMLPAAFMGMDWQAFLRGSAAVTQPLCATPEAIASHPAFQLALWNCDLMEKGYSQLIFFSYIPLWNYFGAWFSQLWAESLGKSGKGSMPVPAVGVTDQHSINQMFLDGPRDKGCLFITSTTLDKGPAFENTLPEQWAYLKGKNFGDLLDAEGLGTRMALVQSGVPLININMGSTSEEAAGRFMGLAMATTLFTGWLLGINPLDQPAVELGKRLANSRLGEPGLQKEQADLTRFLQNEGKGGKQSF